MTRKKIFYIHYNEPIRKDMPMETIPQNSLLDEIHNSLYKTMFETITEGLCVCYQIEQYPYTAFVAWNEQMTRITGYTMEEINELGWYQTIYAEPNIQDEAQRRMERMRVGEDLRDEEWEIIRKDGQKRTLSMTTSLLKTTGSIPYVMALMRDISEQKKMQDELQQREVLLSEITENSLDMISKTDLMGIFQYVTPSHKKNLGYASEEIIGRSLLEFFHEEDEKWALSEFHNFVMDRADRKIECRFKHKQGHYLWLETTGTILQDKEGIPTGLIFCSRDITQRKRSELALKDSENKFKELFHQISDPIFLHRYNPLPVPVGFLEVNHAACQKLGYTREELLTEVNQWILTPNLTEEDALRYIQGVTLNGEITFIAEFRTKNGQMIPMEVDSVLFTLQNENVILTVARDITDRVQREQAQKEAEEKTQLLKEAITYDKVKTEFFSNISHELRTPVSVILSAIQMAELITRDIPVQETKQMMDRYLGMMRQNGYRLIRLLNNLIDMTKMDAGFYTIKKNNLNIVHIAEEISLSVAEYIKSKGIEFIFDTDIEEKIMAFDPDQIERILLNLLSNAVKFTEWGGQIIVQIEDQGDHILITVKDTGVGIPKEKQAHMFERFIQVDKSLRRNHEGSGIGLSLVKSLVEMHGGTISLYSVSGEGSEFTIVLPALLSDEIHTNREPSSYGAYSRIEKAQVEFSDIYVNRATTL